MNGSPHLGSLDIPFHGPVNFILRANTDIEDKFAVRLHGTAFFGKTGPTPQRRDALGERADNSETRRAGKPCL
ncbi:hypothetical protein ACVWZK_001300 [Bradyrhizobium sp. GM0.4]|jgi:hypothetical protein